MVTQASFGTVLPAAFRCLSSAKHRWRHGRLKNVISEDGTKGVCVWCMVRRHRTVHHCSIFQLCVTHFEQTVVFTVRRKELRACCNFVLLVPAAGLWERLSTLSYCTECYFGCVGFMVSSGVFAGI